ncbi:MAG: AP2 domain-containing protein [Lactobacillus sp.]|jgi:hypothetical protein|nr:AP2 domain-containing protein [Lactobacillus sp.]
MEESSTVKQRKPQANDLTGLRCGRLVVQERAGIAKNGNALWRCQCDCGNVCVVNAYSLRTGNTRSCGCLRRENSRQAMYSNPKMRAHIANSHSLFTADGQPVASAYRSSRNHSGVTGVSFNQRTNKWLARLMVHGKYVLMSSFNTIEEAIAARLQAEQAYGIHSYGVSRAIRDQSED